MPPNSEANIPLALTLTEIEKLYLRRQILDWRDKWLTQIPSQLTQRLPALIRVLDVRIESITFNATFKTKSFAEKQLQPVYANWAKANGTEIVSAAEKELQQIYQHTLGFDDRVSAWSARETSAKNAFEIGLATGTTGAAFLGIPVVASVSVQSAGYGLGLLGVTAISWPIALVGAAVVGTMTIFGGSKILKYKENAIRDLKDSTSEFVRLSVLAPSSRPPSLCTSLQVIIRQTSAQILEALKHV